MRFRLTLLALCAHVLLLGIQATFATPPFGVYEGDAFSPVVTVLESNADRVRLHFEMSNLPSPSPINFTQPLPGLWENLNTTDNNHLLPRFSILVALPSTGNPTAVIESWDMTQFPVSPAINLQENSPNQPRVIVGNVGIMGGVRVVPVTVKPIIYTNAASVCSVMTSATVSIEIDDQTGTNPVTDPRTAFSRSWQKVIQSTIINWQDIPNIEVGAESHILMIVPNQYLEEIADFVRWKEQRGIKVTIVPENSIGSNPDSSLIRARIMSEVAASDPRIDYVILVGDETQLAVRMQYTNDPYSRFSTESYPGSYTNESYYSTIEGTDVFPDLFLGRWIVDSETSVSKIAGREVLHERDTFWADSLRFEHAIISADWTEASQRITKRHVGQMLLGRGFTSIDSIWGPGGDTQMRSLINSGQTFVNYRGSGWSTLWWGINFDTNDIQQLSNVGRLPICTGIGCGVGIFVAPDAPQGGGFAETFMLAGTLSQPKGSAGFIGPCWNTHTVYNDCLDSLLYRAFLDFRVPTLMPSLVAGKMMEWALMSDFLDESGVLEIMNTLFRQYLVLCDPSLQVFTDTPVRLDVSMPEAVPSGENISLPVTVNNMAMVTADSIEACAWMGDGQFVTGWIPQGSSTTTLTLNTSSADTIIVTLTGDNTLASRTLVVVAPSGPYISHVDAEFNDNSGGNGDGLVEPGETIDWYEVVQNIGSDDAFNTTAGLTTSTAGVTITQPAVTFGTVPAGQSMTSAAPFTFSVDADPGVDQELNFIVTYQMSNGPSLPTPVSLTVHVPSISLESVQIVDGGNSFWDRDETVNLRITLTNGGNSDLATGTYTLTTDDTLITIEDGTEPGPIIPQGTDYTFADNAFAVHSSWATPAGHHAVLQLTANADMGSYTYEAAIPIDLVIGQVGASDPFTDTGAYYWVYDNSDSIYSEHPDFNWIEIATIAGGSGTEIPFSNGNQTWPLEVPFSYLYYGATFDSLSVSTDGWVRPGHTVMTSYVNFPLPHSDNVPGMIAPLWFNLWQSSGETGQICYQYDSTSDRLIVEWYQIHDISGQFPETFQLQLLNPATYPTQTGDAEWILLYQGLSARATGTSGATVGFEDISQANGATYIFQGNLTTGAAVLTNGRAIKLTTNPPVILSTSPTRSVLIPKTVELMANYPNPFNPETNIEFALPSAGWVKLNIFDVLGRHVATLVNGTLDAGIHRATWHGKLGNGESASSGVYFYRLDASGQVVTRKMVLLR